MIIHDLNNSFELWVFMAVFTTAPFLSTLIYVFTRDSKTTTKRIIQISLSILSIGLIVQFTGTHTIYYSFNQIYFAAFYLNIWLLLAQSLHTNKSCLRAFIKLFLIASQFLKVTVCSIAFLAIAMLHSQYWPKKYIELKDGTRIEITTTGSALDSGDYELTHFKKVLFSLIPTKSKQLNTETEVNNYLNNLD